MSRQVEGWHELPDGREVPAVLHYTFATHRPATYWEPAEGGIEVDCLEIDGVKVDDTREEYDWLVDQLLERAQRQERDRYDD